MSPTALHSSTTSTASAAANVDVDRRSLLRCPAVPAAVAFAVGIGCDALWNLHFATCGIAALLFASLACFGCATLRPWSTGLCLLLCGLSLGAARHHWFWSTAGSDDVVRFADTESAIPARLTGRVVATPVIVPAKKERIPTAWPRPDRTFCRIECKKIQTDRGAEFVSGTVRLQVAGHLTSVGVGDVVEIRGWIRRPSGPQNPGEFDYAAHLRCRGIRAVIYADDPSAVTVVESADWSIAREAATVRRRCEQTLKQHLSDRTVAIGSAMLLGDRSQMDEQIKSAFVQSGMVHILAISGLHVGVLALFAWMICRVLNLSPLLTTLVLVTTLIGYLMITDSRPSVVRATVMIVVMILGRPWYRTTSVWNSLAIAAIVVLAWRPTDLFDAGAQLSFLSVVAIVTSESWWRRIEAGRSPLDTLQQRGSLATAALWLGRWTLRSALMMAVIWLFTAPLVAARFNVVSPIGMAINIVLVPAVGIVLSCGYLLLLAGLFFPPSAFLPAAPFDAGLRGLLDIVDWASALSLGHINVSGPTDIWLVGYYSLSAAAVFLAPRFDVRKWCWCAVCVWTIIGLDGRLEPPPPKGLRCTFLSTGHGVAVLVETPEGRTLLYDAGCLSGSGRAAQAARGALWKRGHARLDAIVISHADVDHFNGIPELLATVPVGRVLIAQSFLDMKQTSVVTLCETAKARGVPIEILLAADRIRLDNNVVIRVLHPSKTRHTNDNANSIVLEIEYVDRRILLTGDLENDGLSRLLSLPPRSVDALLSPHHGSPKANPKRLAEWAQPKHVVVSSGPRVKLETLQATYGKQTNVMSTNKGGAVTFEITPDGTMTVKRGPRI